MSCDCHIRLGPQPPSREETMKEVVEWSKKFNAALERAAKEVGITLRVSEKTLKEIKEESFRSGLCKHGRGPTCPFCVGVWS